MNKDIKIHSNELRDLVRLPVDILVQYNHEEKQIDEFCNNISSGGIFIETINILTLGEKVDLKITLPHNHLDLQLTGIVLWIQQKEKYNNSGMGIKFENISRKSKEALDEAINYYTFIKQKIN